MKFFKLPCGDAFSVIERVKFLKLPSGDAFSVIERVKLLKLGNNITVTCVTFGCPQIILTPKIFVLLIF